MQAVVGLGANLGDRLQTLTGAAARLAQMGSPLKPSSVYQSPPVGPPQPHFLNAALMLSIDAPLRDLLRELLEIEHQFGRIRRERWGPRTLDLDILWAGDALSGEPVSFKAPELCVPHGRLLERAFALIPLCEVAPHAKEPEIGLPYRQLIPAGFQTQLELFHGPGWAGCSAPGEQGGGVDAPR